MLRCPAAGAVRSVAVAVVEVEVLLAEGVAAVVGPVPLG